MMPPNCLNDLSNAVFPRCNTSLSDVIDGNPGRFAGKQSAMSGSKGFQTVDSEEMDETLAKCGKHPCKYFIQRSS